MYKIIENPSRILSCYFCERDVAKECHILCDNCSIEICVYCFCQGKQLKKHRRHHKYSIIQDLEFSIFMKNWSAYEELKFLQGLEIYGYGNWEDVSKFISTNKDAISVEQHWQICYNNFLNDKKFDNINKRIKYTEKQNNKKFEIEFQSLIELKKDILKENIREAYQFAQDNNFDISQNNNSIQGDILGFMPLRREFDVEYDNEAELLLAEMEFLDTDTQEETNIKINILSVYNERLKQRKKRKDLVINKNLLNLKKKQEEEKNMSKDEFKIRKFLRPYERFLNEDELNEFVQLQLEEIQITNKIKEFLYLEEKRGERLQENDKKILNGDSSLSQKFADLDLRHDLNKLMKQSSEVNILNDIQLTNLNLKKSKVDNDENLNFCEKEIKMCEDLNIELDDYIIIKEALVRNNISNGFVDRNQFISNIQFPNESIIQRIIDLHEEYNLVNTKQLITQNIQNNNQ